MQYEGDNMAGLKRSNRSMVLGILHEQGSMSRKRIAQQLKLTPAAITKIVGEMIDEGLIVEGRALSSSGAGRREIEVSINPRRYCALGLLINLKQAIVSSTWLDGTVIFSEEIAIEPAAESDSTVSMLCRRLLELADTYIADRETILGVGIAVRGITSPDERRVVNSFGALDKTDYPLCNMVEHFTSLPSVMSNNVRSLFSAHTFLSHNKSVSSSFFLRCEYGIGAAMSINGQIWKGSSQQCAEIGHIPVVRSGGKLCSCGKRGCLETISSPSAIIEDTVDLFISRGSYSGNTLSLDDIISLAKGGDGQVAQIVDSALSALSQALKGVIYTIDPDEIVLYGRMFDNEYIMARLLSEMHIGVDENHAKSIKKSEFNLTLEDKAASLTMVDYFFSKGGLM